MMVDRGRFTEAELCEQTKATDVVRGVETEEREPYPVFCPQIRSLPRERAMPADSVAIYDLEGELFFGAAPDLEDYLAEVFAGARARDISHIVLRVKRVRDPDAVCLERLERALHDARDKGFTVLLAGIRPDLLRGMQRLGWSDWLPRDHWFLEEDTEFSSTLRAVRRAYELAGERQRGDAVVYYLV